MKDLINKQREYFNTNATKSVAFRKEQLKKLQTILKQNEALLLDAIFQDFKKSEFDTYSSELVFVYHDISEAIKKVGKWSKIKRARTNLLNFPAKTFVIPEPLGVTLVIGAWNYPYLLSLAPAVAAIAAGNTVILKPSELPPNTSRALAKIINENFDSEYFHVIEGGVAETTALLAEKFDKIFFTGSVPVGKIIYQAAAKHLTPVTLELGGKSPAIITAGCNLKMAAKRIVWAKFLNAGQTCISPDYILIDPKIKSEFIALVKSEIEQADYSTENDNYVQIINNQNVQRLAQLIDSEKVIMGGEINVAERLISPTVLDNVTFEDPIMQEEIFGPIMPILTYNNLDEAIAKVKSYPKPLSLYVFTKNKNDRAKILRELSFGGGGVNETIMQITNHHVPFGGVGESGIGAYHGESGFKSFSHYKSILDKPTWFELNLKYSPLSAKKLKWVKFMTGRK
ncbi:MAG: aldehyde dehydrogenase family protein [Crocinitomix sp.]|nr:aldehyde dehydrogenase family protein [Crocinitomix sp.]